MSDLKTGFLTTGLICGVVVVLGFYVWPTAKVIQRRDIGLKSHRKDWRSPGSNPRPLVYKVSSLTTTPGKLLAWAHMSLVMRKPAFCICENKDADQLRGNREADQRLGFRYTDSTIPLLPIYEISSL